MHSPSWRAAIVDPDALSRRRLRLAAIEAGGAVVTEADDIRGLEPVTRHFDVILGEPRDVAAQPRVPVVVVTADTSLAETASRRPEVMAIALKPATARQLSVAVPLAIARFTELRALERSLAERKIVERAKGQLMVRLGVTEEEAYRCLRKTAMDTRSPLVDVARRVIGG